jgi:4'-phosphopantetheinyl transferase
MTEIYWLEQDADDMPFANYWLTAAEIDRLATLQFAKRREEWRLGRWTAKRAVAAYLAQPPDLTNIEIRNSASGAPEVFLWGRAAPLAISLSHRAGRALCALSYSGAALGCDLELVEPRVDSFVEDYFTAEEQAVIAHAPPGQRDRLTTLFWSAKESVLKALKCGLRSSTHTVSVSLLEPARAYGWDRYSARTSDGGLFGGWWFESNGFVRTLAIG